MAQLKSTSLLGNLTTTGTTLAAKFVKMGGTSSEILMADGSVLDKSTVGKYPTTWTWTAGTTSGPTASITGTNLTAIAVAAIPSASASASGVVTTGAQTFAGRKTFNGGVSSGADLILSGTTASTSTTTGALTVAGGVGISGATYIGGNVRITSTTSNSLDTSGEKNDSTGALIVDGAAVFKGPVVAAGGLIFDNTTEQSTDLAYYLGINAFASNGKALWSSKANVASSLGKVILPVKGNSYTPVYVSAAGTLTNCSVSSAGNAAANTLVVRSGAGQINAEKVAVTSSGTAKSYIQYNTTEECLEFIFA